MRLNFFERLFILSPLRTLLLDRLETRQLLAMGGTLPAAHALEVGCGPGRAIGHLFRKFHVARVDAFDLDPAMVARVYRRITASQRRHQLRPGRVRLWAGNVRQIPVAAATYDVVFNFGVIHHVVDWRSALVEIHRVLKPGGHFYCEEILGRYITHPLFGRLMDHPQEDRFDAAQFVDGLRSAGFHVKAMRQLADLYIWVVAAKNGAADSGQHTLEKGDEDGA
ncbi:MAG: class I SAM-dependent methyltransferase [Desulfosarcinaceae bacterium]|nr:class I SAM-dependent methyltransferase [Desulfosarcinaceae bacterium]